MWWCFGISIIFDTLLFLSCFFLFLMLLSRLPMVFSSFFDHSYNLFLFFYSYASVFQALTFGFPIPHYSHLFPNNLSKILEQILEQIYQNDTRVTSKAFVRSEIFCLNYSVPLYLFGGFSFYFIYLSFPIKCPYHVV